VGFTIRPGGADAPRSSDHHALLSFVVTARTSSQRIDELEEFIGFVGDNEKFCFTGYPDYGDQARITGYANFPRFFVMNWISFADCNG
jgi:hypothetical protein